MTSSQPMAVMLEICTTMRRLTFRMIRKGKLQADNITTATTLSFYHHNVIAAMMRAAVAAAAAATDDDRKVDTERKPIACNYKK